MTEPDIATLEKVAELNNGHCDRCGQTIKIYRTKPNIHHARMLRRMADVVERQRLELLDFTEANKVNFDDIEGSFTEKSQRTKMRHHGFIAKVRDEKGAHVANTWLITSKGFDFLEGKPVPATVVVYDNQVLGHEGGTITIGQVLGEPSEYESEKISTAEAEVYGNAREPKKVSVAAEYKGRMYQFLKQGSTYHITTGKLQVGKPLEVFIDGMDRHLMYNDIATFQREWKVL